MSSDGSSGSPPRFRSSVTVSEKHSRVGLGFPCRCLLHCRTTRAPKRQCTMEFNTTLLPMTLPRARRKLAITTQSCTTCIPRCRRSAERYPRSRISRHSPAAVVGKVVNMNAVPNSVTPSTCMIAHRASIAREGARPRHTAHVLAPPARTKSLLFRSTTTKSSARN